MNFETYLINKKIDAIKFKNADNSVFESFSKDFHLMHEASFTAQKLFLINKIRRKFPLVISEEKVTEKPVEKARPKMIMKPKNL